MSLKQQDPVVSKLQDRNDSRELPHASPGLQTPLLAPSLVPVASPRLLSQEAWVSLGAGLPLGEACRLGALQPDGHSGRIEEGLGAPCVHMC